MGRNGSSGRAACCQPKVLPAWRVGEANLLPDAQQLPGHGLEEDEVLVVVPAEVISSIQFNSLFRFAQSNTTYADFQINYVISKLYIQSVCFQSDYS